MAREIIGLKVLKMFMVLSKNHPFSLTGPFLLKRGLPVCIFKLKFNTYRNRDAGTNQPGAPRSMPCKLTSSNATFSIFIGNLFPTQRHLVKMIATIQNHHFPRCKLGMADKENNGIRDIHRRTSFSQRRCPLDCIFGGFIFFLP